mgnify:CR=1 FL=1
MNSDRLGSVFVYEIDRGDCIVSVSGNWDGFLRENQGAENTARGRVIGTPLWAFIAGDEPRHLYKAILKAVRAKGRPAAVRFRCDAPDRRRFLELRILPRPEAGIRFESEIIRTEPRPRMDLLAGGAPGAQSLLSMCSVCKKIAVAPSRWEEVETAVNTLSLFDQQRLPRISHGLCPACYEILIREVDNLAVNPPKPPGRAGGSSAGRP